MKKTKSRVADDILTGLDEVRRWAAGEPSPVKVRSGVVPPAVTSEEPPVLSAQKRTSRRKPPVKMPPGKGKRGK